MHSEILMLEEDFELVVNQVIKELTCCDEKMGTRNPQDGGQTMDSNSTTSFARDNGAADALAKGCGFPRSFSRHAPGPLDLTRG